MFKRKTKLGETKEYHYKFMQSGKWHYGVCEGCNIQGDGTAVRSYLYGGDLVKQLQALLDRPEPRLTVNLGSDRALTIRELAELVRRAAGTDNSITVAGKPDAYAATSFYVPDVTLARRLLATGEPLSLEAALERVIRFHRQTPAEKQ